MLKHFIRLILFSFGLCFMLQITHAEPVQDLLRNAKDPVTGNHRGQITIVEFFDYQCSHCTNMVAAIDTIIKSNPHIRFVFKDFPMRGTASDFAARAALAANKQGKYYKFYHALLSNDQPLSEQSVLETARSVGLNIKKLRKDMDGNDITKQLQANMDLGKALRVPGTPVFYFAKTDSKTTDEINYVIGEITRREMQETLNKTPH